MEDFTFQEVLREFNTLPSTNLEAKNIIDKEAFNCLVLVDFTEGKKTILVQLVFFGLLNENDCRLVSGNLGSQSSNDLVICCTLSDVEGNHFHFEFNSDF